MIIDKKNCMWSVYIHISPNNKYYVGITSQKPNDRWRSGKGYEHNSYFMRAINKYGWDNFQHEIIASNLTEKEAKNFEKLLIKELKSNDKIYGYNMTAGGDGVSGLSRFGEDNPFYGKHHNTETKKIISEANKGKQYWLGKRHSDESKQKMKSPKTEKHKQLLSKNHSNVKGSNNPRARKIIRLEDNKIFDYLNGAANEIGVNKETLRKYCKLHNGWMYLDEYVSLQK